MAPVPSTISRSLRSQLRSHGPNLVKSASRGITVTASLSNSHNLNTTQQSPSSFVSSDLYVPSRYTQNSPLREARNERNPFSSLLNALTHTLTTTPHPSIPQLHNLLRTYTSDPTHWSKYAHANPDKQYTRNLVCEVPGVFNLLLLVWTPGKKSPIHDHADAHCLMKVLKGEIREARFAIPERPGEQGALVQTSNLGFGLNKVSYMADQLGLHSISNPHPVEYAVSLHLYTPPNAAMRGCQVFDQQSGEAKHVMQGLYDSVGGEGRSSKLRLEERS